MAHASDENSSREGESQRLDKWLWFSRILKSRTLAAQLVGAGKVRINRTRALKPSQTVRAGDVLTIALRGKVQILRILAPGHRRGPPAEAATLYETIESRPDLGSVAPVSAAVPQREPGSSRPSKRDRRMTDRLTDQK